jgi:hypothetical protein
LHYKEFFFKKKDKGKERKLQVKYTGIDWLTDSALRVTHYAPFCLMKQMAYMSNKANHQRTDN